MSFSVLMSVYEKENPGYLAQALESMHKQTLQPTEIVMVKDGMLTQELETVIAEYQKRLPQLRTYQFEKNVQLGRALAKGVKLCRYELIARMDTDDIAVPERFEHQYQYMTEHKEVAVCGGWLQDFDDAGKFYKIKKLPKMHADLVEYNKYRNPLNHMTVMFRKSAIVNAGNYQHFPFLEDYYLWNRVLADGGIIHNLQETLVYMRTNDDLYRRRGGMAYFRQYVKFRRAQRALGLLNAGEYRRTMLYTAYKTLQPAWYRKFLYRRVLRK